MEDTYDNDINLDSSESHHDGDEGAGEKGRSKKRKTVSTGGKGDSGGASGGKKTKSAGVARKKTAASLDKTTLEGQLAAHPDWSEEQGRNAAKKEYHRLNAAASRLRQKEMVTHLKAEFCRLTELEKELECKNEVLKAQVEILRGNGKKQGAAGAQASMQPGLIQQANASAPNAGVPVQGMANMGGADLMNLLNTIAPWPEHQRQAVLNFVMTNGSSNGVAPQPAAMAFPQGVVQQQPMMMATPQGNQAIFASMVGSSMPQQQQQQPFFAMQQQQQQPPILQQQQQLMNSMSQQHSTLGEKSNTQDVNADGASNQQSS